MTTPTYFRLPGGTSRPIRDHVLPGPITPTVQPSDANAAMILSTFWPQQTTTPKPFSFGFIIG
jgi:hypothetical protein